MRSREKNKSIERRESGIKWGETVEKHERQIPIKKIMEREKHKCEICTEKNPEREKIKERSCGRGAQNGVEREQRRQRENRKGDKGNQTGNGEI